METVFVKGKIREGRYAAMISDGMGTGNDANKESKKDDRDHGRNAWCRNGGRSMYTIA